MVGCGLGRGVDLVECRTRARLVVCVGPLPYCSVASFWDPGGWMGTPAGEQTPVIGFYFQRGGASSSYFEKQFMSW